MLTEIYLRKDAVYLPTVAKTEAGFYCAIDPVTVVAIGDSDALRSAIKQSLAKENPMIRTPARDAWPEPVVLKYAKVKYFGPFFEGRGIELGN